MICPNCGTEGDGVFCAVCGYKMPSMPDTDLNPASRRRAAEKAAQEAEAMRRRYEEAAEAARSMLKAVEDEETAAKKARAEKEESLRKAVIEAEALLSDKTAKLTAAQAEQLAAERLLAERKASLSEFQNTGSYAPNIPRVQAESSQPIPESPWAPPSIKALKPETPQPQTAVNFQPAPQTPWQSAPQPIITPPMAGAPTGPQTPWADANVQPSAGMTWPGQPERAGAQAPWADATRTVNAPPAAGTGQPSFNSASPWAAPPSAAPLWAGSEPTQSEIWDTIVKNTPHDPDAENVLRKAAGYWKDAPPAPADPYLSAKAQPPDPRLAQQSDIRNQQQDPWGLGNAGAPWQPKDPQYAKQPAAGPQVASGPQAASVPKPPAKQREEKSRRPAKTNDDDFEDDNDEDYDDDDEEEGRSFFQGVMSAFGIGNAKRKKHRDYSGEDDDNDEEDEDDEGDEYDDDEEDEGNSNLLKKALIAILVVILLAGLIFAIAYFLKPLFTKLISGDTNPARTTTTADLNPVTSGTSTVEAPVTVNDNAAQNRVPSFADPAAFMALANSAISAKSDGRLVYCCPEPAGVYLMNDDYANPDMMSDRNAYSAVYQPPWIYFSTSDGIYRVNQDNKTMQPIISETYDTPHNFYVYNNYLYYTRMGSPGVWNIDRFDLAAVDDSTIPNSNQELIVNVNPNFYMDSFGVYSFAEEGIDHPNVTPLFSQPITPQQGSDDSQRRKNVFFSSLSEAKTYQIANLYMDKFVTSRPEGVVVQATEQGVTRERLLAWQPDKSDYAPRESFAGADGAAYELRYDEHGSYSLSRQADAGSPKQVVADNIDPGAYYIYNNSILYYLTAASNADNAASYKMMKYDTGAQNMAAETLIDFGVYDQAVVDIASKIQRGDASFDRISQNDAGRDRIFFSGLVVTDDDPRQLLVTNRTNNSQDTLSPVV